MILDTFLYFDVVIGDQSNFLDLKDLIVFNMTETTGIELPILDLTFRTINTKVKDRILENNPVQIKLGQDQTNSDTFILSTMIKKVEDISDEYYICHLYGFLTDKKFLLNKVIRAITGNSLSGLQQVSSEYFNSLDSTVDSVNDESMNWLVANHANQTLMTDMWLHMNIIPSFPLIGISRYGKVILRDFNKLKQTTPTFTFVQQYTGKSNNEILFLNCFDVENRTHIYNAYAGYGKVVNIFDSNAGNYNVFVNSADPNILATSQEVETSDSGNRVHDGYVSSDNTHSTYHQSYFYNTSKLMQLGNMCGSLEFKGAYHRELNLLDIVNVQPTNSEKYATLSGKYIVNSIEYKLSAQTPFTTVVYVCRDSMNHVENNLTNPPQTIKIPASTQQTLLEQMKLAQMAMSVIRAQLGGTLSNQILSYLTSLKSGAINSFTIPGLPINFASQISVLAQLQNAGRNILIQVLSNILPAPILTLLQSQGLGSNFNLISLLQTIVNEYAPAPYQSFFQSLVLTFNSILNTLSNTNTYISNSVVAQNSQGLNIASGVNNLISINQTNTTASENNMSINLNNSTISANVTSIVQSVISNANAQGIDIPIPVISITESLALYNTQQLTDYIINETVTSLNNSGYLTNVDVNAFIAILKGGTLSSTAIATQINSNIGSTLYTRNWGTFKNLDDLTQYYIRNSYTDKFKTVPCIKTINASGGRQIFFALPSVKTNLTFYTNSTITPMESYETTLGYTDVYGNLIPYTIYYTTQVFNSNSTLVEIRG